MATVVTHEEVYYTLLLSDTSGILEWLLWKSLLCQPLSLSLLDSRVTGANEGLKTAAFENISPISIVVMVHNS